MGIRRALVLSVPCILLLNCMGVDKGELRYSGINPSTPISVQQEPAAKGCIAKAVPAPEPHPEATPVGFSINPDSLLNLPERTLLEKMGTPAVGREALPAVIWTYIRGECRLDIYLYESPNTEIRRSLTNTVASTRKDVAAKTCCLAKSN